MKIIGGSGTGGGGGTAGLAVQNIAALKALDTTSATLYPDKLQCYVEDEENGIFFLDRESTATPDDLLVVQPTIGSGRWIKKSYGTVTIEGKDFYQKREVIFNFGDSTPFNIGSVIPVSSKLREIIINVITAWNGTTPTLDIGLSGDTSKFMANTEIDLKVSGIYSLKKEIALSTNNQIIGTYAQSGATQGQANITFIYTKD